jgi:hypothetical protein
MISGIRPHTQKNKQQKTPILQAFVMLKNGRFLRLMDLYGNLKRNISKR